MATKYTPALLRQLDGLPNAAIELALHANLNEAPLAGTGQVSHDDFCDFRRHILAEPRQLRGRYPNVARAAQSYLATPPIPANFWDALRIFPSPYHVINAINLTIPLPALVLPMTPQMLVAPAAVAPAGMTGLTFADPDIISGAIWDGCIDCVHELCKMEILPYAPNNWGIKSSRVWSARRKDGPQHRIGRYADEVIEQLKSVVTIAHQPMPKVSI